jgi:catechol-2,3-dioxygenase
MTTTALDEPKIPSPTKLAHVVLRTSVGKFDKIVDFYKTFVGGQVISHKNLAFIRYDNEHHRLAIISLDNIESGVAHPTSPGLDHICFTYANLKDLGAAYRVRKSQGILPVWCTNHGPGTSMYYRDPDGNQLECQVDNFDDMQDAINFIEGPEFNVNPIGVDFDPEELFLKVDHGVDDKVLKKRADIGPRTTLPANFERVTV